VSCPAAWAAFVSAPKLEHVIDLRHEAGVPFFGKIGPAFENDVLAEVVFESNCGEPLRLIILLHQISIQIEVSLKDLPSAIQADEDCIAVGLHSIANAETCDGKVLSENGVAERIATARRVCEANIGDTDGDLAAVPGFEPDFRLEIERAGGIGCEVAVESPFEMDWSEIPASLESHPQVMIAGTEGIEGLHRDGSMRHSVSGGDVV
jgi:hypothetical protein